MKKCVMILVGVAVVLAGGARANATVYDVYPNDDLFATLGSLVAGDEVIVHAGTYSRSGFYEVYWNGTLGAPIVVRAAAGDRPLIDCASGQNIINIHGEHFEFRGFELTGGSHGIRLYDVHDAVLEDLHLHHTEEVALSANITGNEYYNVTLRHLHIHDTGGTGEGMYLGCNTAGCIFRDNLIEGNWIHDTNHGTGQGDGIEIKQGSYGNVVRNNVVHDTKYPCIIVYGTQGNAVNLIENNVVWNCADSGIQAASDAIVRNNIVINSMNGILSKPHDGAVPGNLTIVHNTVITCGDRCLRGNEWAGTTGILVANNAFYNPGGSAVRVSSGGEAAVSFHHNVILGSLDGVTTGYTTGTSVAADFVDAANQDVWPTDTSALIDQGDTSLGVTVDFNWAQRDSNPDVGAYEWASGGNPGWDVESDFRDIPDGGVPPAADAAVGVDAAPGSDAGDPQTDAGDPQTDAGDPQTDGATPGADGATPGADAGDAEGNGDDGCGCQSAGRTPAPWLLLLGLLLWLVRRRRS